MYGGGHLFRPDSARKLGGIALRALEDYAPDPATFAAALDMAPALSAAIYPRILEKLRREPVEDYRVDFEDGYGSRADSEEDAHARQAANAMAEGIAAATLPPLIGIRVKPMTAATQARALRTLDLFMTTLVRNGRRLPLPFTLTLPKITSAKEVAAAVRRCESFERRLKLGRRAIRLEIMAETPAALIGADGRSALRGLVRAGRGRVTGVHFGPYDYTSSLGIAAAFQDLRHPACDHARQLMLASLAGTGVYLADGPTTLLPIAPHRQPSSGADLKDNHDAVHRAWKRHFDDVTHSLRCGFYQGWDLHPGQLPTRYAAVYAFFQSARPAAIARLRNFLEQSAHATRVGNVFDDTATARGLFNFFTRGIDAGALTPDEVAESGLSIQDLRTKAAELQPVVTWRRSTT